MEESFYRVGRLKNPMSIDADWDKPAWAGVASLPLLHYMGTRPSHFPRTQAKLLYDEHALYIVYRVEDQFVRARATRHQDPVYKDSCVEFFFTPGLDTKEGYFNLEINCGGIVLFHYQKVPRKNAIPLTSNEIHRMELAHSLPQTVEPELAMPTVWVVECRLPWDILAAYFPAMHRPVSGDYWKVNFYKCADESSRPHWLTWSKVDHTTPDFHRPESFGSLVFD